MNLGNSSQIVLLILHYLSSNSGVTGQQIPNYKFRGKDKKFRDGQKPFTDCIGSFCDINYSFVPNQNINSFNSFGNIVNNLSNNQLPIYNYVDPTKTTNPLQYQSAPRPTYQYQQPQQQQFYIPNWTSDRRVDPSEGEGHGWSTVPMEQQKGDQMAHEGGHGWSKGEQKHIPHKKKKGKKSALGKLIDKKLKHGKKKHQPLVWKEGKECDGFENFIKDLEIIALKLGWAGFAFATLGFILHVLNQIYGFFSVVKIGLPDRLATFFDLIAPGVLPETLTVVLAVVGLLDYLVTFFAAYPLGNVIIFIEGIAEILTLPAVILATLTAFDDIVVEKVWAIFGIDLEELFDGYGCDNPFSKEKKIKHFFENLSGQLSGENKGNKMPGWGHNNGHQMNHGGWGWARIDP